MKSLNVSEVARRIGWSRQRLDYYLKYQAKHPHARPLDLDIVVKIVNAAEGLITFKQLRPDLPEVAMAAMALLVGKP